jgi:hypothetical protein
MAENNIIAFCTIINCIIQHFGTKPEHGKTECIQNWFYYEASKPDSKGSGRFLAGLQRIPGQKE